MRVLDHDMSRPEYFHSQGGKDDVQIDESSETDPDVPAQSDQSDQSDQETWSDQKIFLLQIVCDIATDHPLEHQPIEEDPPYPLPEPLAIQERVLLPQVAWHSDEQDLQALFGVHTFAHSNERAGSDQDLKAFSIVSQARQDHTIHSTVQRPPRIPARDLPYLSLLKKNTFLNLNEKEENSQHVFFIYRKKKKNKINIYIICQIILTKKEKYSCSS